MFELKTTTECELTRFVGRTQKAGKEDVPAVSFYLRIANASNVMLDMLSPTMRLMAYAPIEGQTQLEGVELTTPVLRSPDMKLWKSETVHEGWRVFMSRGIGDEEGLQMGSCKLDDFTFDLYQGGHVDCEFRVSTGDVDEEGAGMLWGRQKRKVFVMVHAPELPPAAIDGTVAAFKADHPDATDLFAAGEAEGAGPGEEEQGDDGEGNAPDAAADAQASEGWPFPKGAADGSSDEERSARARAEAEQAELEAGMGQAIAKAGVKPARGKRATA